MHTLQHYTELARKYAPKGTVTKSAWAWYEKGKARQEAYWRNRDPLPREFGLWSHRAKQKRIAEFAGEIRRRGFDTTIQERHGTVSLGLVDRADGLWLLGASGWRHYSNRFGDRFASIAYLCGQDDNGLWAVRVPGTVDTVEEALEWSIPKEVQKARGNGRRVLRQGDVFALELKRDGKHDLPDGHEFDPVSRELSHEGGHKPRYIPWPCKFVTARGLPPRSAYNQVRSGFWFD